MIVYAAGEYNAGSAIVAVFWKNGTMARLTDGSNSAVANSIFVVGDDIYVAGYEVLNDNLPIAKYWKNGVSVPLTAGTSYNSGILYALVVVNNDVYAGGFTGNQYLGHQFPTYWKNGVAIPVGESNNTISAAQSIFVQGNDVYVAGKEKKGSGIAGITVAKYWKNKVPVTLTDRTLFAGAYSMFVPGTDVYTAGYERNQWIFRCSVLEKRCPCFPY